MSERSERREFVPLTTDSVAALVAANPRLAAVTGNGEVTAEEVGDGNLNQVFIVRVAAAGGTGIVLKQALPYLRVAGEGWPLTRERMRFETQSPAALQQDLPRPRRLRPRRRPELGGDGAPRRRTCGTRRSTPTSGT